MQRWGSQQGKHGTPNLCVSKSIEQHVSKQAGGFSAISRWLGEATPPVTKNQPTASRRDASKDGDMNSTFILHYQIVFSTKHRQPFIDAAWRDRGETPMRKTQITVGVIEPKRRRGQDYACRAYRGCSSSQVEQSLVGRCRSTGLGPRRKITTPDDWGGLANKALALGAHEAVYG